MTLRPALLEGRDRYERVMDGWVDNTHEDALTHTVHLAVFVRRRVARLERADGILRLFHSMHDDAHGFELTYEIDIATGRVLRAESVTPKLPYQGICSEPQRKIHALAGETVDDGLRKRIQAHVGGVSGCAQLYDLTSDLLKLLRAGSS